MKLMFSLIALAGLASAQEFHLGARVQEFQLRGLDGKMVNYSSLKGNLTVVAFIATQCPVSNAYNERMKTLYQDYSQRVKFIFINSNATESAKEVGEHAQRVGFPFPVYKDVDNIVADRFGAQSTPEMYVIDQAGVMQYHGHVDDSQNPARVKVQGMRMALNDLLAGKPVALPQTKAFGCTIKRGRTRT
jgi:peroxiredoxin